MPIDLEMLDKEIEYCAENEWDSMGMLLEDCAAELRTLRQQIALADELAAVLHDAFVLLCDRKGESGLSISAITERAESILTRYRSGGPSIYALAQKALEKYEQHASNQDNPLAWEAWVEARGTWYVAWRAAMQKQERRLGMRMGSNHIWPKARWNVRRLSGRKRGFWFIVHTPPYHHNRGPYISIGLGIVAIYRGY